MDLKKIILLVPVALIVYYLVMKSNLLDFTNVNVRIDQANCINADQVKRVLELSKQNFITFDDEEFRKKIQQEYSCVLSVETAKVFPHQLGVDITGRKPIVEIISYSPKEVDLSSLEASPSSQSALTNWNLPNVSSSDLVADENGFIFKRTEVQLPVLYLPDQKLDFNTRIKDGMLEKIDQILEKLHSLNLDNNLTQIKVDGSSVLIFTEPKILFSTIRDIKIQLASLQLIWHESTIDERKMDLIDLRFDKPVVVYTPKKRS